MLPINFTICYSFINEKAKITRIVPLTKEKSHCFKRLEPRKLYAASSDLYIGETGAFTMTF